jgi:hypothetical protein
MSDVGSLSLEAARWSSIDHWALAVVVAGVILEGLAEWLPKDRRETPFVTALTRTGWLALVLALTVEFMAQQNKDAADALIIAALNDRAATASQQAAFLMRENLELERALAPRTPEQGALATTLAQLPRVPVFISGVNKEEPAQVARYLYSALRIQVGNTPLLQVSMLPSADWYPDGITIQYWQHPFGTTPDPQIVAEAFCQVLKSQGIATHVWPFLDPTLPQEWPSSAPENAVLVRVGAKPSHFWVNRKLPESFPKLEEMFFCSSREFFDWASKRQRPTREQN